MAKTISDFKFPSRWHKDNKWTKYLDGQVWELQRGVDFTTEIAAARAALYMANKRLGSKDHIVRTVLAGGKPGREVLVVQRQVREQKRSDLEIPDRQPDSIRRAPLGETVKAFWDRSSA